MPSNTPFELLSAIGADCVGALQICSPDLISNSDALDAKLVSNIEIEQILKQIVLPPSQRNDDSYEFRISLADAQEKTAFLKKNKQWMLPIGTTPTSHIFKLPIGNLVHHNLDLRDSCENEWLCLQIAKAYGIPTANADLLHFGDQKVLSVERFDRRWSKDKTKLLRLPQEDFCQALGFSSNLKYQSDGGPGIKEIMNFLLGSIHAKEDRVNFFKVQVLFWILAAPDGHAKNFSIQIKAGGRFQLTPLYDVISFYPVFSAFNLQQHTKMAMAIRGSRNYYNWVQIQARHFLAMAKYSGFPVAEAKNIVLEMLEKTPVVVEAVKKNIPKNFNVKIAEKILKGLEQFSSKQLDLFKNQ